MSVVLKRRSLFRFTLFVVIGGILLLNWRTSTRVDAQQTGNQQTQRPRRVSDQGDQKKPEELDEGDVVRVDTQLVSIPAVVTDSTGRPLAGLHPENFQVFEDGQAQTIANFGTAETPFEIALLLDTSGSTRDDVVLIRQAANSFIEALRPGDRVGVVSFNQAQTVSS